MTRTTNARVAGFTYLFYAAIGVCIELLMHQARGVGGDSAANLARLGQYATNVHISILIVLLECFSALVLAVTLYGITRHQDHELAMLALVCRVVEGVLGTLNTGTKSQLGSLIVGLLMVIGGVVWTLGGFVRAPQALIVGGLIVAAIGGRRRTIVIAAERSKFSWTEPIAFGGGVKAQVSAAFEQVRAWARSNGLRLEGSGT